MIYKDEIEFWTELKYADIVQKRYKISSLGRIMLISTNREIYGNNPTNEKGYVRISLKINNGKNKKFSLHRLVIGSFEDFNDDLEVNHIDGNKLNNRWTNLEYTTRKENAEHASRMNLYDNCEDHYKSLLTNEQVYKICKLMEDGHSNSEIQNIMDLKEPLYENIISKIRHGKSWKRISSRFNIPIEQIYKTYKKNDIENFCISIFIHKMKISEIISVYPQYNSKKLKNLLKKIKQRKLYKNIINQIERSETIESIL